MEPSLILIFGTNCVGKSTVGTEIARRLPRCSFIEVDELRYKVVGGLVAYSDGTRPERAPEEYERQCWMGVESAVAIARVHQKYGFSCVMEGLEDECEPDSRWIEEHLTEFNVVTVGLVCDLPTVEARWRAREGLPPPKHLPGRMESVTTKRDRFDYFLDTGTLSVEHAAEAVTAGMQ